MQKGCVCLTLLVIGFYFATPILPDQAFSEHGEDAVDVWDVFSNLHHNDRGKLETYWASVPEFQMALSVYLKAKIDAGVVDGETSLPPNFVWYEFVGSFPVALREDLYEHAQEVLESSPDNGAAAKLAAIVLAGTAWDIPQDGFWDVVEKAMVLLPNDVEVCYLAFEKTGFDYLHEEAVTALERLFERHQAYQAPTETSPFQRNVQDNGKPAFSQWVYRFCYDYQYVNARPNDFYQRLEGDHPLRERWNTVLGKIQLVFEEQIKLAPDEWIHTRMLAEIHEVLGNTEEVQAVFQRFQLALQDRLKQNPDDRNAWRGLANLHEKLGNSELAHAYRVNADPPLAWVGKVLPDFSSAVDLDGKPISIIDYRGKVVLLDFWATSYNRIPTLGSVYEKYHHRGFDIIGINLDVDERLLREFIEENPLPWRQIFDGDRYEGPLVQQYGVRSIPRMFLLDRGGKVISVNVRDRSLDKLVAKQLVVEMD